MTRVVRRAIAGDPDALRLVVWAGFTLAGWGCGWVASRALGGAIPSGPPHYAGHPEPPAAAS